MEFTSITKDNYSFFQPLLSSLMLSEGRLFTGVIVDGSPAGVAVFSAYENILFLDYLYIPSGFRHKGIGKALLNASLEEIRKLRDVPVYISFPEYKDDLLSFFESMDFRYMRDGRCFTSLLSVWFDSKPLQTLIEKSIFGDVISLADLTFSEKELLEEMILQEDLDPKVLYLPELDNSCSYVEMDPETGAPEACILVEKKHSALTILLLANFSHQPEDLLALFSELLNTLGDELSKESELTFLTMDEGMRKLACKLASDPAFVKPMGTMISCTDIRSEEENPNSNVPSLYECFSDPQARSEFLGSWILESRLPKNPAEGMDPEEEEYVYRTRTYSKSQLIKRGLKFLRKADRQRQLLQILKELPEEPSGAESCSDLSVFEYRTDNEFMEKLPKTWPLLQKLKQERGSDEEQNALLDEIIEDYENQLALMKSPYYVLLAGKNAAKLSSSHIREMRQNLELEQQKENSSLDVSAIDSYLSFLEKSRKEDVFGKGKKIRQ